MKLLIAVTAVFALLSFTPRLTHAQTCCGRLVVYEVPCGGGACGDMSVPVCESGSGGLLTEELSVPCLGCGMIYRWVSVGPCDSAEGSSFPSVVQDNSRRREDSIYVNTYVKDCRGQYVAVQMPMERQAG